MDDDAASSCDNSWTRVLDFLLPDDADLSQLLPIYGDFDLVCAAVLKHRILSLRSARTSLPAGLTLPPTTFAVYTVQLPRLGDRRNSLDYVSIIILSEDGVSSVYDASSYGFSQPYENGYLPSQALVGESDYQASSTPITLTREESRLPSKKPNGFLNHHASSKPYDYEFETFEIARSKPAEQHRSVVNVEYEHEQKELRTAKHVSRVLQQIRDNAEQEQRPVILHKPRPNREFLTNHHQPKPIVQLGRQLQQQVSPISGDSNNRPIRREQSPHRFFQPADLDIRQPPPVQLLSHAEELAAQRRRMQKSAEFLEGLPPTPVYPEPSTPRRQKRKNKTRRDRLPSGGAAAAVQRGRSPRRLRRMSGQSDRSSSAPVPMQYSESSTITQTTHHMDAAQSSSVAEISFPNSQSMPGYSALLTVRDQKGEPEAVYGRPAALGRPLEPAVSIAIKTSPLPPRKEEPLPDVEAKDELRNVLSTMEKPLAAGQQESLAPATTIRDTSPVAAPRELPRIIGGDDSWLLRDAFVAELWPSMKPGRPMIRAPDPRAMFTPRSPGTFVSVMPYAYYPYYITYVPRAYDVPPALVPPLLPRLKRRRYCCLQ